MNRKKLTLGSLFSGSGGFELAGLLAGIEPIWASDIEPFPVRVTTKRFPRMKHYGDIHKLSGTLLEPVDVITFGSPCQSMSLAGKREGIEGDTQSSLFWQAIRIIKEMRDSTHGEYPRYAVWENVTGALSSRGGEDFKAVLEAFIDIAEPRVEVPAPLKNRWPKADLYLGDGWSVAYRVLDAQYWGVPQSRERIYLVADFTSDRAGDILFKSEGFSGYTAEGFRAWQKDPASLGVSAPMSGGGDRAGECIDDACTLGSYSMCASDSQSAPTVRSAEPDMVAYSISGVQSFAMQSANENAGITEVTVSRTITTSQNNPAQNQGGNAIVQPVYCVQGTVVGRSDEAGPSGKGVKSDVSFTLTGADRHLVSAPVYASSKSGYQSDFSEARARALTAGDSKDPPCVAEPSTGYVVRRFTPIECARLQGFPDWWCGDLATEEPTEDEMVFWRDIFEDHRRAVGGVKPKTDVQIKKWLQAPYSDGGAYKMWGNGIALPCAYFVLAGVAWAAKRPAPHSTTYDGVELLAYTPAPVELCGKAAAVCTASDDPARALKHAMNSGHMSVLEHVTFSFRVSGLSRAALAQLTRHRLASFDVQSQRYVKILDYKPVLPDSVRESELVEEVEDTVRQCMRVYKRLLDAGIPAEDARYITPQAVPTELIMTMNARELRHFFSLRTCHRAQWEIRRLAEAMLMICHQTAPELFDGCGPGCVTGTCPESRPCGQPRSAEELA